LEPLYALRVCTKRLLICTPAKGHRSRLALENPAGHGGRRVQGGPGLYQCPASSGLCSAACAKDAQSSCGPQRPQIYLRILPGMKLSNSEHRAVGTGLCTPGTGHPSSLVPSAMTWPCRAAPTPRPPQALAPVVAMLFLRGSHLPFRLSCVHVLRLFPVAAGPSSIVFHRLQSETLLQPSDCS